MKEKKKQKYLLIFSNIIMLITTLALSFLSFCLFNLAQVLNNRSWYDAGKAKAKGLFEEHLYMNIDIWCYCLIILGVLLLISIGINIYLSKCFCKTGQCVIEENSSTNKDTDEDV